jgi:hypothetical protein
MRLAQHLGVDLVNLGLGGGANCERAMADYIASRNDWNLAVFEIGINMLPRKDITTEEFRGRVRFFLQRTAKSNPDRWIFCTDMFTFVPEVNPGLRRHGEFRRIVREEVEALDLPRLFHVDGRSLLRDPSGLSSLDLIHPSPHGMEQIAHKFSSMIKRKRKADT